MKWQVIPDPKDIPIGHTKNFDTLLRAIQNDDVILVRCLDRQTGLPITAICIGISDTGKEFASPYAVMIDGDPRIRILVPDPFDPLKGR